MQSLYHLSDEQIRNLTIKEFFIKQKNLISVAKLYNPYIGGEEGDRVSKKTEDLFEKNVKEFKENKDKT